MSVFTGLSCNMSRDDLMESFTVNNHATYCTNILYLVVVDNITCLWYHKGKLPLSSSQVFFSFKRLTKRNLTLCWEVWNQLCRCLLGVYKLLTNFIYNERMLKTRALLLLQASTSADVKLLKNNVAGIGTCALVLSWTPVQCMLHETSHL